MSRDVDLLRKVLTTSDTLTPMIIGAPGIAKTAKIRKLAKQLGMELFYYTPGTHGEGMMGVVPVPGEDGHLHFPAPAVLANKFKDGKPGLFFVDEANTCPPALQPALLGLILEGRIGDYTLPKNVRRVAAMNPVQQAAGGWELPAALANRMIYMQWSAPSASEWTEWLLEEAETPANGNTPGWIKARSMAAAYHRKHPGQLSEDPDKVLAGRFPPAFATPRTWESAVRMLATCYDTNSLDEYPGLCEGILGKPIAIEWNTYLRKNDLPDPEDLLADPMSWKPNASESDKVFATCFAVAEAAVSDSTDGKTKFSKKDKTERWNKAWRVLDRALPLGKGMVAVAARRLAKPENRPDGGLLAPDVRKIISQLKDVIQAAGLIE